MTQRINVDLALLDKHELVSLGIIHQAAHDQMCDKAGELLTCFRTGATDAEVERIFLEMKAINDQAHAQVEAILLPPKGSIN